MDLTQNEDGQTMIMAVLGWDPPTGDGVAAIIF
jgi:hypothetical protein